MSLTDFNPIIRKEDLNSFTDIYRAIEAGSDFSESQLFYLGRLVERKLAFFDPRFISRELEMKPYEH